MKIAPIGKPVLILVGVLVAVAAYAWYDKTETSEIGYPGVAMQITDSEDNLAQKLADNVVPAPLPPPPEGGALAAETYENVHVLGHLTTGQFTRLMTAITIWVAPEQGCAYCHNTANLASDELYPKVVSRRMLQMTMAINEQWQPHVAETGVTCYTCHRGNNVPEYIWFDEPTAERHGTAALTAGQNMPVGQAGLTSLPGSFFEMFLSAENDIRVQSTVPLPSGNRRSIKQTEWTYGLMMHFSNSLGVNCTFCHNSRSWADWSQSPAQRGTAWYGIRMVRSLNEHYLESIADVLPEHRLGELGDVPKVNCATCHQGAYRPLLGQSMLGDYPALARAVPQPAPADDFIDDIIPDDAIDLDAPLDDGATGGSDFIDEILGDEGPVEPEPEPAPQPRRVVPQPAPAPRQQPQEPPAAPAPAPEPEPSDPGGE